MAKYWETEAPISVQSGKNVLRYYPQAGKLWVSKPDWQDEDGETKPGKTVAIDLAALKKAGGAKELLRQVGEALREE